MKNYILTALFALTVSASCKKEEMKTDVPDICRELKAKETIEGKYYFTYTNGKQVEIPKATYDTTSIGATVCYIGNKD